MKRIKTTFLLFSVMLFFNPKATSVGYTFQNKPGDSAFFTIKRQLLPISLITSGLLIESLNIKDIIQDAIPGTNNTVEDYLQYAPIAILYSSDLFKINHKNNVFNQSKYLIISELATDILTTSLKKITRVIRPNGNLYSFPSGHTSQAFTGATVLYMELEDYNKPLALSGYLFSTTTGALRVTNNKHWISDVLVGAGLGIIITRLVYHFEPLKNWNPFKAKNNVAIFPDIDLNSGTYLLNIIVSLRPL